MVNTNKKGKHDNNKKFIRNRKTFFKKKNTLRYYRSVRTRNLFGEQKPGNKTGRYAYDPLH